ncbi:hypothetical protein B0H16DRAFT_1320349, partial [Mycena metata]
MAGVPREHTDFLQRRFDGRTTRLVFDDYTSAPFPIADGLDQGDPQSVACYGFFNAPLARVEEEDSGIYIDDYHVLAEGDTLVKSTAAVVDVVEREGGADEWAEENNSKFGPEKDQACHFSQRRVTRKRPFGQKSIQVPEPRPELVINGVRVKPSKAVKLVGVWLDENLTFKQQGAAAIARGHEWLVQFRRLTKLSGGAGPRQIHRFWTSICLPGIMYASEVWLPPLHQRETGANRRRDGRGIVTKLASIQRRAMNMVVGGMASSPGDLIEAHADILPMNLLIDKHLQKAALRYATLPETHPLHRAIRNVVCYGHVKKHPSPLHFLMTAYKDVRQGKVEVIPAVRVDAFWEAPVDVRVASSKEEAKEWALAEASRVTLFSDGSLIDGKVGAAGLLCVDGVVKRTKGLRLGSAKRYGVYEAEGVGQVLALECL